MKLVQSLLTEFKWYRKRLGGKWYNITYPSTGSGFASELTEWVQQVPVSEEIVILKEEFWQKKSPDSPPNY